MLSLYFSFLRYIEEREDVDTICRMEQFDIRTEKEFWDDIKKGLVLEFSLLFTIILLDCGFVAVFLTSESFRSTKRV